MQLNLSWSIATLLAGFAVAQFPRQPEGVILKQLEGTKGISISYKETFICETSARAWAGYVHLPASELADVGSYNISMFFWYFEARKDPSNAPTAIYLAGGPGDSSVSGTVQEAGPCTVLEDANSTANNPYSYNNYVNMLYVDQPVSTGFSYSEAVNSTLDLMFLGNPITETGVTPFEAYGGAIPPENTTFLYGTLPDQSPHKTANNTFTAAKTLWHFSQAWFSGFPEHRTSDKNVNFIGNSYAGYYIPVAAEYILKQNAKIKQGQLDGTIIPVDTVAWTNGCTDELIQGEYYPDQAYNNTYGLQVIPEDVYHESKHNFTKPGGCRDLMTQCRELGDKYDPDYLFDNAKVNKLCVEATEYCFAYVLGAYDVLSNRSVDDMSHLNPDGLPTSYYYGYLNQAWVQEALGVPVNFSTTSLLDNNLFVYKTGDTVRIAGAKSLEFLLKSGVKVNMMYGDRDYRCPWNGGEALSLAIKWPGAADFSRAGYEYVQTNASYQGGVVKQHGNLSFTRILNAGHIAGAYDPDTVSQLFTRAIFNNDLATGKQNCGNSNNCTTSGPTSSFGIKNVLPKPPPFNCNLYGVLSTCTIEQYEALQNGTAKIVDFNVVKPAGGTPGSLLGVL